jgi:hypothetical protein
MGLGLLWHQRMLVPEQTLSQERSFRFKIIIRSLVFHKELSVGFSLLSRNELLVKTRNNGGSVSRQNKLY